MNCSRWRKSDHAVSICPCLVTDISFDCKRGNGALLPTPSSLHAPLIPTSNRKLAFTTRRVYFTEPIIYTYFLSEVTDQNHRISNRRWLQETSAPPLAPISISMMSQFPPQDVLLSMRAPCVGIRLSLVPSAA